MFRLEYNPVTKNWKERMANLPKEKREQIETPIGRENLAVLKRTRKGIETGDVFVLSLDGIQYFYGKVLEANIKHLNSEEWFNGCHLIFIFKEKSKQKNLEGFRGNYDNLLIGPRIVTSQYWSRGWFEKVGNVPLTEEDISLDYGFWDGDLIGQGGTFKKANGEEIDHQPKYFSSYGITCLSAIYDDMRTECIINPSLLNN